MALNILLSSNVFPMAIQTDVTQRIPVEFDELAFRGEDSKGIFNVYFTTPYRINNFFHVLIADARSNQASVIVHVGEDLFDTTGKIPPKILDRCVTKSMYVNEVYRQRYPETGPGLLLEGNAVISHVPTGKEVIIDENTEKEETVAFCMRLVHQLHNNNDQLRVIFQMSKYLEKNFGFDMFTLTAFLLNGLNVDNYYYSIGNLIGDPRLFFSTTNNSPYCSDMEIMPSKAPYPAAPGCIHAPNVVSTEFYRIKNLIKSNQKVRYALLRFVHLQE